MESVCHCVTVLLYSTVFIFHSTLMLIFLYIKVCIVSIRIGVDIEVSQGNSGQIYTDNN